MGRAWSFTPDGARHSESAVNLVPCVQRFRHGRFGRQIKYLARFPGRWNELRRESALLRALVSAKPQCRHLPVVYATSMLSTYEGRMIAPTSFSRCLQRAAAALSLLGLGIGLAGCADMSDGMTSAFADPAKYDLYECKQLEPERKSLAARAAELQGLMAKAQTGVAGPVVAELAYRNDYIAVRGQTKLADEAWQRNKCVATPEKPTQPQVAAAPPAKGKRAKSPMRSGTAVN